MGKVDVCGGGWGRAKNLNPHFPFQWEDLIKDQSLKLKKY